MAEPWHSMTLTETQGALGTGAGGLPAAEAQRRLTAHGRVGPDERRPDLPSPAWRFAPPPAMPAALGTGPGLAGLPAGGLTTMTHAAMYVMLAEDDEALRDLLSELLEGRGHRVVACGSGHALLNRLRPARGPAPLLRARPGPGCAG